MRAWRLRPTRRLRRTPFSRRREDEEEGEGSSEVAPAAKDGEKIRIQIESHGGAVTTKFRMFPTSSFSKMMDAWCDQQEVPRGVAHFELCEGGRVLLPGDTPASCGGAPRPGSPLRVRAEARGQKRDRSSSASSSSSSLGSSADGLLEPLADDGEEREDAAGPSAVASRRALPAASDEEADGEEAWSGQQAAAGGASAASAPAAATPPAAPATPAPAA
ncbi:unnamed protein product, partial [Prorocentrum cordatum]